MRALACPASLKGVVSAVEAAALLAEGLERGGAEALALPVADGGEGTAEVIGGETHEATVSDPLGRPIVAHWVVRADGSEAPILLASGYDMARFASPIIPAHWCSTSVANRPS